MSEGYRPARVLFVIHGLHFGGAENVVLSLVRGMDRDRFEPVVLCINVAGALGEQARTSGLAEIRTLIPRGRWRKLTDMGAAIRELKPDCLHSHGGTALLMLGATRPFRQRIPWVHTYHFGNYPHTRRRYLWAERACSRLPDRLVAVSDTQRLAIQRHLWVRPDRIRTIMNGVAEHESYSTPDRVEEMRRSLGYGPDDVLVGTVAVLSEQKGVRFLIDAAQGLIDRKTRLHFVVVGGGPLETELREQVRVAGLGDRVQFLGWRDDASAIMPALDVFAMPSLWEGLPLALLEAMAAARPIVTTAVGDNAHLIRDGDNGRVVQPADPAGLSRAIEDLVRNPDERRRLGQRAREDYRRFLTVEAMTGQYAELYAGLVGSVAKRRSRGNVYDGA